MVQSIERSLETCSPFSESTLLVAFEANPEEVERMLRKSCKKVLSAPIDKDEYAWFRQYVYPSSVWMMRSKHGQLLFEDMLAITQSMTEKIHQSMDSIYTHLGEHQEWSRVTDIKNETVIARQDDERVGLLHERGIRDIAEVKHQDEDALKCLDVTPANVLM